MYKSFYIFFMCLHTEVIHLILFIIENGSNLYSLKKYCNKISLTTFTQCSFIINRLIITYYSLLPKLIVLELETSPHKLSWKFLESAFLSAKSNFSRPSKSLTAPINGRVRNTVQSKRVLISSYNRYRSTTFIHTEFYFPI